MAVTNPVKVKGASIVSSDIVSFDAGLDERGDYNIAPNAMSYGRNAMANSSGNGIKRLSRKKWLPNCVGFNGELSTVFYNNQVYYFIADNGKIRYIQENSSAWIDCGGANAVTTTPGTITTFMRSNNWLLVMNGVDEMRYIDLVTFNMVQFTFVPNPVSSITATASGITASGAFRVYYGFTYNSNGGGETAVSNILSQAVSKSRTTWNVNGTEFLTLAFNDTPPAGATSRNLYAAISLQSVTPVASDLAMLQTNIPLAATSFVDNGSLGFSIEFNTAPSTNSTRGLKVKSGSIANNVPVVYGDPENPYDLNFGTLTATGVSFGANNGGQRLPLMKGTNFYPTSVVGFRNNQNVPNLLALFSSTDSVSKQQVISQKTITYGNTTIQFWGADDLNAGASSVYSPYGVVISLGELLFPASEGITSLKTEADLQNFLSPSIASEAVGKTYRTIKNANFDKIVGAAWNNLAVFAVPSRGYNYNNQMIVRDMTNRDKPRWAVWDLAVDWVGSISPFNQASFLYIRQGNQFFKLQESYVAEDENADGTATAYPVTIEGNLKAFSAGKNAFFAASQAVVYLAEFVGSVDVTVTYINKKGKPKSKTKRFSNGSNRRNIYAGWGNPRLGWISANNRMTGWSEQMAIGGASDASQKKTKRCRIRLPNPVINEYKVSVSSNLENTSFDFVNSNLEGINIGVIGDIV